MIRILILLGGIAYAGSPLFAQTPKVSSGSVKRFENFASKYVDARNIDVWLPKGYSTKKKYQVLYMHDGQMLFDSAITWNHQAWEVDEVVGKLISQKKIKPCIVVGIWNSGANRDIDYVPQKPFETISPAQQDSLLKVRKPDGSPAFSGKVRSDKYLKFLVTELKPFIDKTFSTLSDRKNTFIAGSSKGGLISMYAICEYPAIFGGAACLSTHWTGVYTSDNNPIPDKILQYLSVHLPSPKNHRIYFDYGTETLDVLYERFQLKADAIMKAKGYTTTNWITKKFQGDDHSENAWRKRLHIPMTFLLNK
ncbi:hypothetical protein LK994_01625 [Ferruginibacter lapsinanis]|uniref:alpha/beta hydrolase n=1 Tax=Ferruginibacter lapsinanis TaxID=563172 RepID=UPI001E2F6012|nr:alpha/beta hydrolase-fold protein [Ferruginibacter lapsinanis]UEG50172.1 hypothetical protein LK994_01625 [Ferruginibacter lapsinanis]